uniref:Uncharacterized protein n=1 Tax=Rhizophora mucronata TaxID=61149 RepID=A0A2P2PHD6_RHIMU
MYNWNSFSICINIADRETHTHKIVQTIRCFHCKMLPIHWYNSLLLHKK